MSEILELNFMQNAFIAGVLVSIICGPVSYTHLDVYKRQYSHSSLLQASLNILKPRKQSIKNAIK